MKIEKKPGPLPLEIRPDGGGYTIVTAQQNFYAKTYSSFDAKVIAAGPNLLALALKVEQARLKDWEGVNLDEINDLARVAVAIVGGR